MSNAEESAKRRRIEDTAQSTSRSSTSGPTTFGQLLASTRDRPSRFRPHEQQATIPSGQGDSQSENEERHAAEPIIEEVVDKETEKKLKLEYNAVVKEYNAYVPEITGTLKSQGEWIEELKTRERDAAEKLAQTRAEIGRKNELIRETKRRIEGLEEKVAEIDTKFEKQCEKIREMEDMLTKKEAMLTESAKKGEILDKETKETVHKKLIEILSAMQGNGYPVGISTNSTNPVIDNGLGICVMEVLKKVAQEGQYDMPKREFPARKFFGWVNGRFYPRPEKEVPRAFLAKKKPMPAPGPGNDFGSIQDVAYLSVLGAVCSWRAFTEVMDEGEAIVNDMLDFVVSRNQTMEVFLENDGKTDLENFAQTVMEGIIPPGLRVFFGEGKVRNYYVSVTLAGIAVIYKSLIQRTGFRKKLPEVLIKLAKESFHDKFLLELRKACKKYVPDVVGDAVVLLQDNFSVRFSRDQAKVLLREARKWAMRQEVEMPAVLAVMEDAYGFQGDAGKEEENKWLYPHMDEDDSGCDEDFQTQET